MSFIISEGITNLDYYCLLYVWYCMFQSTDVCVPLHRFFGNFNQSLNFHISLFYNDILHRYSDRMMVFESLIEVPYAG